MTDALQEEFEDIEACARQGRRPRDDGPYRVLIGDEHLDYHPFVIADPVPTGRQLLDLAKLRPVEEYVIFGLLADGLLEEIRLEETFELRTRGVEKFLTFKSDRIFRFILDGHDFQWAAQFITGKTLIKLAQVDEATYRVWLQVKGQEDKLIGANELVDLSKPGVERFFTGVPSSTEGSGEGFLPSKCRKYLEDRGIAYDEVEEGAQKGLVLRAFSLPAGRFSAQTADILILLPAGYPDNPPDMFYAIPWLQLAGTNRYPVKADQPVTFNQQRWQRWSRHNNEWRRGVDGIWTMLKRVETALELAA